MSIVLETERMLLREFTEADVDHLVALDGDPEVMRYITGGKPTPRARIENEVLPRIIDRYRLGDGYGGWAAIEKPTGVFLGRFAFHPKPDDAPGDVELGYRLCRAAWGRGYATEGSRALIHRGFTELGTQRVYAETMAVNTGSRRVMEKSGLRYVRTFHPHFDDPIEGTEHGEVEYELRRADWRPDRP